MKVLYNKGFTELGIFYQSDENLFGGFIEWRESEIFVPCIPIGSDFHFDMLPFRDVEIERTDVNIIRSCIKKFEELFNIEITIHYISVLPDSNLPALLITSLGPWLVTPEPYVETITKLDNGLATYYPYPVKITPNFIVNETISKIIYMREIKRAFIY